MQFRKITAEQVVPTTMHTTLQLPVHTHLSSASLHLPSSPPEPGVYMTPSPLEKCTPTAVRTAHVAFDGEKHPSPVIRKHPQRTRTARPRRRVGSSVIRHLLNTSTQEVISHVPRCFLANAPRHKSTPDNSEPLGHFFHICGTTRTPLPCSGSTTSLQGISQQVLLPPIRSC